MRIEEKKEIEMKRKQEREDKEERSGCDPSNRCLERQRGARSTQEHLTLK